MWSSDLRLHEQVLLLALHDEKGTLHSSMFAYALGGAIIAELLMRGALGVKQADGSEVVFVAKPVLLRDPLLDECLELIGTAHRPTDLTGWIARLAAIKNLKDRVAEDLCERGIVKKAEDRVMWVFPRIVYPTADPAPERRLVQQLERAIADEGEVDARVAILVGLAHGTGILPYVFDRSFLEDRRSRIDRLARTDAVGAATKKAIDAVQTVLATMQQPVISGS